MGRLAISLKWVAMRALPRSTTLVAVCIKILVATYMPYGEKLEIKTKFYFESLKTRDNLDDIGADETIIISYYILSRV
jgi:hypothetical protein